MTNTPEFGPSGFDFSEEPASVQVEYRADAVLRELDDFIAMAANHETVHLIEANKVLFGQIMSRAQLIASFLLNRGYKPGTLRVVKNG